MKVLLGTYDECRTWARRHDLKSSQWRPWNGVLFGLRLKSSDIVVLGSWWETVRPSLPVGKFEDFRQTLATRMDRAEPLPEL